MTDENIATEPALAENALPIGTTLMGDQFTITDHLGAGGFGITYRARDNVLERTIVIKECFTVDFCVREGKNVVTRSQSYAQPFRSIVAMFMREARSLAKLRHPNIVGVHRAFEENGTAYMVIDLIEGRDLFDILESDAPKLSPGRVRDILLQLLDAVEKIHEIDLLHRDISPDNILIEESGTPVLIDFGAARGDASRHTRAVSSLLVVKDGYSPQEFYVAGSDQTPSSDLYALGATFYHVLSGAPPANSQTRMLEIAGKRPDPCAPLAGRIEGYDPEFLQAIDTAMQVHPADRLQSAAKWRSLICDAEAKPFAKRPTSQDLSLDLELSLSQLVEETNNEVRRTSQVPEDIRPEVSPPVPEKPEWAEDPHPVQQPADNVVRIDDFSGDPNEPREIEALDDNCNDPAPMETPPAITSSQTAPDTAPTLSAIEAPSQKRSELYQKVRRFCVFLALLASFSYLFLYDKY